ncbi:hypothetical protein ACYF6T_18760 [Streptomyces sp. 7R007]
MTQQYTPHSGSGIYEERHGAAHGGTALGEGCHRTLHRLCGEAV